MLPNLPSFSDMAPQKKQKNKKRKRGEEEEVSHVSQTDDEVQNDSDDLFKEEDYKDIIGKRRKVVKLGDKTIPNNTTPNLKNAVEKAADLGDNANMSKLELMQAQINELQSVINNFLLSQSNSTGDTQRQDSARKEEKEQTSGDSSGDETDSNSDASDSSEDSPLKEHLYNVAGGSKNFIYNDSIPLHAFIDKRLKKKIWGFKFIDFMKLLDKDDRPKSDKFTLEISDSKLAKIKSNEANFQSFQLWDKAFSIYLSVQANNPKGVSPKLIDGLLQYRITILDICRNGGNWSKYDTKFRKFVHNSGQPIFAHRIPDLYHQCLLDKKGKSSNTKQNLQKQSNFQKQACFNWNLGQCDYRNCKYSHVCRKCKSSAHTASKCNSQSK